MTRRNLAFFYSRIIQKTLSRLFERDGDRLVIAAAEMALVHLMQERREDGWSLAMIADAFNADHIPGKNGGKWYGRTVKNILENSLFQTVAGKEAA